MDVFLEKELYYVAGVIYIFLIMRNIKEVKKNTNTTTLPLSTIIAIVFAISAIPIVAILLFGFALYRLVIGTILKNKHGPNFDRLLSGSDAFHMLEDFSNGIITVCLIVRCKKYTSQEFYDIWRNLLKKCLTLPKFNYMFLKSLNYSFMLKQKLDIDDCVAKMKIIDLETGRINKKELIQLLNYHCNEPMPNNGQIAWQVLIGTQSVEWREKECDYYPVMFKVHHAVGDGITLMKLLIGVLADKQETFCFIENQPRIIFHNMITKIKTIFEWIRVIPYCMFLLPSSIVMLGMYRGKDKNIFCNKSLTNQKILGIGSEENKEYVEKIKKIKKKIPEVSFSGILLTAYSASLDNYYRKNCTNSPQHITATIPVVLGSSDTRSLVPGNLKINDLNMTNSYSLLLMNLPINIAKSHPKSLTKWPLIDRLRSISQEANILKTSTDYYVNYLVLKIIFAILPLSLLEGVVKYVRCTTAISSLAGPPNATYGNGLLVLSDVLPWVPHLYNVATSLCAITYEGRLQMGISADKAVIPTQKDAQVIVDDVYRYLDMLENEVEEFCKS